MVAIAASSWANWLPRQNRTYILFQRRRCQPARTGPGGRWVELIEAEWGENAFTHLFADTRDALERHLREARASMARDGMVWASWPKKSSDRVSEIARADVMSAGKSARLLDVKVCAVDET